MSTAARKARRKRGKIRIMWDQIALKTLLMPTQIHAVQYLDALGLRRSPGNGKQLLAAWSRLKVDPRGDPEPQVFSPSLWQKDAMMMFNEHSVLAKTVNSKYRKF